MNSLFPRISTPQEEGAFQAAKWLKLQALLDGDELRELVEALAPFWIVPLTPSLSKEPAMAKEEYLEKYGALISLLQIGKEPLDFSEVAPTVWVRSPSSFWLQEIAGRRFLVRPSEPWVQVQVHQMTYSAEEKTFYPMALSEDAIFWGLQFSFPGIYQEPRTLEFKEAKGGLNWELFQILRRWIRDKTMATPMQIQGEKIHLPIRIGKRCFGWIDRHPGLSSRDLKVER
jgi:hypothetical protein